MHAEHILGIPSLLEDIVQLAIAPFILFARVLIQKDVFQLITGVNHQQIVAVHFGIHIV